MYLPLTSDQQIIESPCLIRAQRKANNTCRMHHLEARQSGTNLVSVFTFVKNRMKVDVYFVPAY